MELQSEIQISFATLELVCRYRSESPLDEVYGICYYDDGHFRCNKNTCPLLEAEHEGGTV